MADDTKQAAPASHAATNFDRLGEHLEEGSLATRLLGAYRGALVQGEDARASMSAVVATRLAEVKEQSVRSQDQQD
jgi:hypothetical protein